MFPLLRRPTPDSGQPDAEPRAAVLRLAAIGQRLPAFLHRPAASGSSGEPNAEPEAARQRRGRGPRPRPVH
eukprot:4435551-Alexandrium_andersonii.AAC.1